MRYKATVEYDGTNYSGWQIQNDKPSIQNELNKAISKITNEEVKVTGSGRTDGKVHAYGQVFHFDTDKKFKDIALSINSQLPADIHIKEVVEVSSDFHARYSALWKHYDYLICDNKYSPMLRNYVTFTKPLDIEKMQQVKQVFIGTHDFTSFNATGLGEIEDQVRTIYDIEITRLDNLIRISYYGDGFLRYMVRILSAVLIAAGNGKISEADVIKMLDAKSKSACHLNSEPQGLYLMEVGYDPYEH